MASTIIFAATHKILYVIISALWLHKRNKWRSKLIVKLENNHLLTQANFGLLKEGFM